MEKRFSKEFKTIGLRIAYYRKLKRMTQEDLAEAVHCSAAYIGHLEAVNVDKSPSLYMLFLIAEALDVPAYKLLMTE